MRSKSRARKVANDGAPHTTDQLDGQADSADDLSSLDGALGDLSSVCQVEVPLDNTSLASSPDSPDSISAGPGRHMAPLVTASHKVTPPATSHKVAPISASHKIAPLPSYLELRSSGVGGPAPGVWTTEDLTQGQRILALAAVAADDDDDDDDEEEDEEMVSGEKQLPDHYGKRGRGWLENNDPDVRRWTKYVRGAGDATTYQPNVVTVQLNDQVYYRTLRGISAGQELLTSGGSCGSDGRGPRYPAQQRHQGTTLHNTGGNGNGRNGGCVDRNGGHLDRNGGHVDRNGGHVDDQEQKQLPCIQCGEVFRSKVALRRHQTYVCYNRSAIFGPARRQIYKSASSSGTHTDTDPPPEPASHRHDDDADDRGTLPQRSNAQEMIQDAHRVAASASSHLSSPQPGHDQLTIATAAANAAANAHRYDHLSCRLDDGLGRLKQYGCENCEKVFIDSAELQRHIRSVHVGARSHTCTDCGKTFATSSGLKQHQHIHSSVKPFQCEVCLKAYTQFSNLCRHKRMHADCRQQIKCKDCGQTFSTMTSLGKHKRFCQGMLSNGSTGRSMSGYPASSDKPSAGGVGAIRDTNSAKMSAFSSPYGVPFYGQRPAFPFFPPVGAGFPMFPTAHPMAAMMSANLSESKRHRLSHDDELSRDLKDSKNNDSDLEQEKNNGKSSRWASDHSNISTDFGKSDFDSESDSEHVFQHGLHDNGRPIKTSSPALASPIPIIKKETRPERDMEVKRSPEAFDLSTILSSSTPKNKLLGDNNNKSTSSSSGEQPLDLSYKVTKDDLITPRKTHIFGREERKARALPNNNSHHSHSHSHLSKEKISLLPKSKPQSPATTTNVSLSPKGKLPVEASPERTMHEAYPSSTTSQLMMSRMYGHSLEKHNLEAYQEAARFMSMAPSRFQFPGMPAPFHPFTGALPGMFHHQSHLDQAKSMAAAASSPAFMRGPASFPYAPGMNKLKDRYTCKFCGKIFPRSANLTRHLRTHTGEQPYKCKYCERSFSISSNLQRHIRNIHNKEKPFKCPICDRCFGQQTNLDRHLKKHEFEGPIVADSPIMEEHDLDELTPLTTTELGSTGSSGHASELSSPVKEDKEPPALDKMAARHHGDKDLLDDSLERGSEELEDDWDHTEATDDDDDDDLDDELHYPAKKAKLLNNNLPADSGYGVMNLSGASS